MRYRGVEYQLFEECLTSAILSRELERPRTETDGRFDRAERIARKYGTIQQLLRCAYARAWTAFNWYDDFDTFNLLYDEVEEHAAGSIQAADIQLVVNLWMLLYPSVFLERIQRSAANLDARTAKLKGELCRLIGELYRPGNSLQAQSNKLLIELFEANYDQDNSKLEETFKEFGDVLNASKGLISFPIDSLIETLMMLGNYANESPAYDELFEVLFTTSTTKENEAKHGRLCLRRGYQKLSSKKWYEAISWFGRAQQFLASHECTNELVVALGMCSSAYESAGLLWAARGNLIAAASLSLDEFWREGRVTRQTLFCLQRLMWIEVQLGCIPNALAWLETAAVIAGLLGLDGEEEDAFVEERNTQDLTIGILLLKTKTDDLQYLASLPLVLERLGLACSHVAALFALGQTDLIRKEGSFPEDANDSDVEALFTNWIEQPVSDDIAESPVFMVGSRLALSSCVLGCRIVIEFPDDVHAVLLAEAVLAAIEAFLSTSLDATVMPHRSSFRLRVTPSESTTGPMSFAIQDAEGISFIEIYYPSKGFDLSAIDHQESFRGELKNLITAMVLEIAIFSDANEFFEKVIKGERGLERALNFTGAATTIRNVLDDNPKIRLSDWIADDSETSFSVLRASSWYQKQNAGRSAESMFLTDLRPGVGDAPPELRSIDSTSHRDRRVLSILDMNMWDRADWKGLVFGIDPISNLPVLCFAFGNRDEGRNVSLYLQQRLGSEDTEEEMKISIIKGIDSANPAAYRIVIGSNIRKELSRVENHKATVLSMSRIHTLEPQSTENLDQFIQAFERANSYIISTVYISPDLSNPEPFTDFRSLKKELSVRQAWEIGENDPDLCGLRLDDDVVVPDGVEDPPVRLAMAQLKRMK